MATFDSNNYRQNTVSRRQPVSNALSRCERTLEPKRRTDRRTGRITLEVGRAVKVRGRQTMANPTSAFLRAGPSFVPSPVTATTSRLGLSRLSMMPLTSVYLSCGDDLARTRSLGQILSINSCFA